MICNKITVNNINSKNKGIIININISMIVMVIVMVIVMINW